jgi:lysozyme family protein
MLMSNFYQAILQILKHEGGWVNNKRDLGRETNYGISMLIIEREKLTLNDLGIDGWYDGCLKKMSVDTAKKLYKRLFWDKYKYEQVADVNVATKVFDAAVNMGPYWGHKLAQVAAKDCGQTLEIDGKFGPQTIKALNACDGNWMGYMCKRMADHYQDIVTARPSNKEFLSNWLKRAAWSGF